MRIRIDRVTAYQLLMLMMFCRDQGWEPEQVRDFVYRKYYQGPMATDGLGQAYFDAFRNFFKSKLDARPPNWQEFIEGFLKQVVAGEGDYGDLIDELAKILQNPYARNALSGSMLTQLRSAILIPSEIGEFKRLSRTKPMGCAQCGRELSDGEMLSIMHDENGGLMIHCNHCCHPSFVKCSDTTCKNTITIDKKYRVGSERYCDDCLVAQGKLKKEEVDKKRAGQPGPTFRGGRRGGGVARAIPAQPQDGATPNAPAIAYTFTVGGTTNNGGQ